MINSEPLILDFSHPNIHEKVKDLMVQCPKEDVLYPALAFSADWLSGKQTFEFLTSGSTGKPQTLSVSRERIIASVEATATFIGLKKGDEVLVCLNTKYTGGKMMLAKALHLGFKTYIIPPSNSSFQHLGDTLFVLTAMVPSQLYTLLQQPDASQILSHFKNILLGGASVSRELMEKIRTVKSCNIYETFGMTETLSHIALRKLNGENSALASFKVLPGVQIRTNTEQCLMVKATVTGDEWVETKDVVEVLDKHHFKWKGRLDNVVNSGGIKLYPEEIEQQISNLLKGSGFDGDYFLTGQKDERLGERLVLVLEGHAHNKKELLDILKNALPQYHSPQTILCVPQFTRTESGKIKRIVF